MLLFSHYVAPSSIHGLGCFSAENLRKGQKIWEFHPFIDRLIPRSDLLELPTHVVKLIETHAQFIPTTSSFRLSADGDYFMNHSDDPNFEDFGDYAIARKEIMRGDEVTCDYRKVKVWAFPFIDSNASLVSASTLDGQAQR